MRAPPRRRKSLLADVFKENQAVKRIQLFSPKVSFHACSVPGRAFITETAGLELRCAVFASVSGRGARLFSDKKSLDFGAVIN
jgi:hypothetical protein